ncbi:FAD-binding domain containing protein [Niveomyces insectorum RCEF 264]|uniref:FAD-binding domain containing protein n=1 Tax=Niveomyces insectorum RCEF 264 TaxID=1081102 RepID=A0A162JF53_9HYPO|nr:FAD-binding domain containing protein [Niveomyces insectorum RCEF 264]
MVVSLRVAAVAAAAAVFAPLACGQSLTVDNTTIPANDVTVAPAAADVSAASSNASTGYFAASETLQLTPSVLANLTALNLTGIDLFTFGNESDPAAVAAATKRALNRRAGGANCKRTNSNCKVMPGSVWYPSELIWDIFGLLLGRDVLIKTVPIASPCYKGWHDQDAAKCAFITNNWGNDSYMHADDPTSIMWPLYQGQTCMPTDDPNAVCTLGGYPSYAVAATNVAQIQLAVNFARNANLRLVVKNTGHDFNGKSAGAGALSIWTHNLKQIQYYANLRTTGYSGPAFKMGAGVQAFEMYEAANQHGVSVVGGEGKTVGVMGGYVLGGGHSPLSPLYGMASDQVLAMEVVLPNGAFVTASSTSHPDLFWALRGGGGSTFGVVTSVTVKAYPKMVASVATFSFATGPGVSVDLFWQGVNAYLALLPTFVDAGTYAYFDLIGTGPGSFVFAMAPFFAPKLTQSQLEALLAPLLHTLTDDLGIPVAGLEYFGYDNFYDAWNLHFPLEAVGATTLKTASRLFPRANFEPTAPGGNATLFAETVAAIRTTVEAGGTVLAFQISANPPQGYPDSAVNPAWRQTVLHAIQAISWAEGADAATAAAAGLKLTNDWMALWRATCPEAGAYMSEGDILEPNFQQAFYGSANYERLYAYKQALDPWGLFYAPTAVGSEDWYITGQLTGLPTQNGQLCHY